MKSMASSAPQRGYTVAILARDLGRLSKFADEIAREEKAQVFAIRIDCSESRSVREAFEGVLSLGFVEVLVYNAYQQPPNWHPTNFTDIRLDSFEKSLAVSSVGAFHCAQQVLPGMVERGRGTILFTGCSGSLKGIAGRSELCCGKFALRALSQCLSMEFQQQGIHIAHVIIDGVIGPPREGQSSSSASQRTTTLGTTRLGVDAIMDPDAVAQTYWQLHVQDRSAWTQEIDLRPSNPPKFC
ncbi:unnamed protein product [Malus baccata var. baccata]